MNKRIKNNLYISIFWEKNLIFGARDTAINIAITKSKGLASIISYIRKLFISSILQYGKSPPISLVMSYFDEKSTDKV